MLQYLIVILDSSAKSFCHYTNIEIESNLISLENLRKAVFIAQKENLSVNFIFGNTDIPDLYFDVIESVRHTKIIPVSLLYRYEDGIVVLDPESLTGIAAEDLKDRIVILNIDKKELVKLSDVIVALDNKYSRLNIVLHGIEGYSDADMECYNNQLEKMLNYFKDVINKQSIAQVNVLTDRIQLNQMNNCNAGITNLTVAPNGKFYICPAFFHNDPHDGLGSIDALPNILNKQLYKLDFAPICRTCDAYHCRRCVFLNSKLTLEVNTPSYQQCIISHIERESSRLLLEEVFNPKNICTDVSIAKLSYCDPFELVKK